MLSKLTQKANVCDDYWFCISQCDEYWFYISHFSFPRIFQRPNWMLWYQPGAPSNVNLYKWVPGPTMKVTWWKSFLYVGFLRGSATSKDKFHCRKRKATIPLRNQLQQILAPSQLMEDFLMLFKTACFSNIQALFFHLPFKTVFS